MLSRKTRLQLALANTKRPPYGAILPSNFLLRILCTSDPTQSEENSSADR